MLDHEAAMVAFVKLAGISQSKQQLPQRDKFLLLAGSAACHAGWLNVAERCRQLVLNHNPRHLVGHSATLADALRDGEYQTYAKQLSRFCSYERAEHYLTQLQIAPGSPIPNARMSSGDYALLLLGKSDWTSAHGALHADDSGDAEFDG